ncbi:MAG TPA: hypothetical protein VFC07_01725, partial [Verrucomicrobiae bacterium]|nr:hypothetical protein [Verrucomicrobiae bacterium]
MSALAVLKKPKSIRWFYWSVLATIVVVLAVLVLRHEANGGLDPLPVSNLIRGTGESKSLFVVVHAYRGSIEKMADVRKAIQKVRPDADVLMVQYPAWTFSNADCFKIAEHLCQEVNGYYTTNKYTNICFVGYSMGALLARKAYVYGWGRTEDLSSDPDAPPTIRPALEWATNGTVKRFVLLAGMNRGWTTRTRPRGMTVLHQFEYTAGKFIGWATGTGHLIRDCEMGSPFVANLRMQWLELIHPLPKAQRPEVIQLLGDTDDVVSSEDNRDVNVSKDFVWVQLSATKHVNATDF